MGERLRLLILGSFDVLHFGHIRFLAAAAGMGQVHIGLGTDEYQASYKHHPVLTYPERRDALEALGYRVHERNQVSIIPLLDDILPDLLVTGWDWVDGPYLELSGVTLDDLHQREVGLAYLPRTHGMSTSEIIKRIRDDSRDS